MSFSQTGKLDAAIEKATHEQRAKIEKNLVEAGQPITLATVRAEAKRMLEELHSKPAAPKIEVQTSVTVDEGDERGGRFGKMEAIVTEHGGVRNVFTGVRWSWDQDSGSYAPPFVKLEHVECGVAHDDLCALRAESARAFARWVEKHVKDEPSETSFTVASGYMTTRAGTRIYANSAVPEGQVIITSSKNYDAMKKALRR